MFEIRIETMRLEEFKAHSLLNLNFRDHCMQVVGDSGTGKTSLMDAWCWLLYEKDARGRTMTDVRPQNFDGKPLPTRYHTEVSASLCFIARNEEGVITSTERHKFTRRLIRLGKGRNRYEFELDDCQTIRADFEAMVRINIPEKLFWLLTFPECFPEKTSIWEKTAILGSAFADSLRKEEVPPKFSRLQKALGDQDPLEFFMELNRSPKEPINLNLPARISEMEGTLRQIGIPDFEAMGQRRDCLEKRREKLQAQGPSLELSAVNRELCKLDRSLGQYTIVNACADRLLKLRKDQDAYLWQQREKRILMKEARAWLIQNMEILVKTQKFFLKDGIQLDLRPRGENPSCRILRKGIPYENLSRREKAIVQLGLLRFLTLFLGMRLPVFLDDWEENPAPEGSTGQFIALCRKPGRINLAVEAWP